MGGCSGQSLFTLAIPSNPSNLRRVLLIPEEHYELIMMNVQIEHIYINILKKKKSELLFDRLFLHKITS